MVDLEQLAEDDWKLVGEMISKHVKYTGSTYARRFLKGLTRQPFVKIMPRDYKRVLQDEARARAESPAPEFLRQVGAASG